MPFSLAILAVILSYIWLFEPTARGPARVVPIVLVVGLTLARAMHTGEWGFRREAFSPAFRDAAWTTLVGTLVILFAGRALGTLHARDDIWADAAFLGLWGGGQQLALQTVLLREAQSVTSRRAAIVVAAAVFGAIHLPNPFLAPVTFAAALVWCWIYDRHPNVIPLALSHAVVTLAVLHAFDANLTGRLRIGAAYLQFARGE